MRGNGKIRFKGLLQDINGWLHGLLHLCLYQLIPQRLRLQLQLLKSAVKTRVFFKFLIKGLGIKRQLIKFTLQLLLLLLRRSHCAFELFQVTLLTFCHRLIVVVPEFFKLTLFANDLGVHIHIGRGEIFGQFGQLPF